MAKMSEQVRNVALSVCDRLAEFEGRVPANSPHLTPEPPLTQVIDRAGNDELQELLREAARVRSEFDAILAAGAGVVAKRSERALGYSGLAQSTGDRTAVHLIQRLTGSTRTEAFRQVKLGGAMGEADAATAAAFPPASVGAEGLLGLASGAASPELERPGAVAVRPAPEVPWHEPLTRAARAGILRTEAVTIVMRGLGEPTNRVSTETLRTAAEEIVADAAGVHADELGRRARQIRDEIDPIGVQERWDQRYTNRSWRFSRTPEGARTAWVQFDEESAAWVDAIVGAAMRPRRGGPRFVDAEEAERAEKLRTDTRSNDQIVFDLMMELLKAGSEADRNLAFGSRQPGVRVVITRENLPTAGAETADAPTTKSTTTGNGYFEETGDAVPGSFIDRQICISGTVPVTIDPTGSPLDVGREERLFTTKQRIALSIRDGGCQMPDCDRPPSYTEAHHIQEWAADGGKTDIADGVLLCRHCHMLIHNTGWKIIREGTEYFAVPPPAIDRERQPIPLPSKSPLARARRRKKASSPDNRSGVS